jgi:hypothetical protein
MSHADTPVLTFPIEGPLTASYDQDTGTLVIESAVFQDTREHTPVRIRLVFAADAAQGFIRLVRHVEEQLDIVIGQLGSGPLRQ